jgi:formylglycine-generating enzyme required for sulfatase activity
MVFRKIAGAGAAALAMLWLAVPSPALAGEDAPPPTPPGTVARQPDEEEKKQAYLRLARGSQEAFRAKDYEKALQICRQQMELFPKHPEPYYNQACAQARLGRPEEALASLAKSVELGFSDAAHLRADDDLASLREDRRLEELAGKAAGNAKQAEERFLQQGREAARRQKETAEKTGLPVEKTVDLGDGIKLEFVLVPPGEFDMGSPETERGLESDRDESPIHRVGITRPFYLGRHEVTQEAWEKLMGANPSQFKGARHPVESVSWDDAQRFLKKLNALTPDPLPGGEGAKARGQFRLPTEAQWEYACRAGTGMPYHFGADVEKVMKDFAWFEWNSEGKTHPVGEKKPNAWGLHDMHGNVWEWCADAYDFKYYTNSPKDDPAGPAGGKLRAIRGGAWYNGPGSCRAANRYGFPPDRSSPLYGLRLATDAPAGAGAPAPAPTPSAP